MTTFKEAFAAARKKQGPGGTFTWNGKKYTTDRADDKKKKSSAAPEKSAKPRPNPNRPPKADSTPPAQPQKEPEKKTVFTSRSEKESFDREKDRMVQEEYERTRKKKPLGSNIYTSAR